MSFKDISYLTLWWPLFFSRVANVCNYGRRHNVEQFCEIILNLNKWFRRRYDLKTFLIYNSGGHFLEEWKICAILVEECETVL